MNTLLLGKRGERAFTLVELLVVIAIIGLLATIVLVSLNTARIRARDVRRVADIRQIQISLELYADANNQQYPNGALSLLVPTYISVVPTDPRGAGAYNYAYSSPSRSRFHLGSSLEESATVQSLATDRDCTSAGASPTCPRPTGDSWVAGQGALITGTPDTGKCAAADTGSFCYDIAN